MSRGQKSEIRMAEGRVGKVGGCDGRVSLFSGGFVSAVAAATTRILVTGYRLRITGYGVRVTGSPSYVLPTYLGR